MKFLDKVTLKSMLSHRKGCPKCFGKGYVLVYHPALLGSKYRVAVPCSCVRQVVRVEDD